MGVAGLTCSLLCHRCGGQVAQTSGQKVFPMVLECTAAELSPDQDEHG